jgi:hypothetical protein
MNKNFNELHNGDRFTFNSKEYVKIAELRISCCRTINAQAIENSNDRIYIQPNTVVTINA